MSLSLFLFRKHICDELLNSEVWKISSPSTRILINVLKYKLKDLDIISSEYNDVLKHISDIHSLVSKMNDKSLVLELIYYSELLKEYMDYHRENASIFSGPKDHGNKVDTENDITCDVTGDYLVRYNALYNHYQKLLL